MELKRNAINQESYEALMEIGKLEKRKDIYAILLLAKERSISHRVLNTELLDRDEEHAQGKRLITLLVGDRLLEKEDGIFYRLTEAGRNSLESEDRMVPLRYKGYYLLHTASDPLLCESILDYEALDSNPGYEEINEIKAHKHGAERKGSKPLNIINKPERLHKYGDGSKVPIVCKGNTPIYIHEIDGKVSLSGKRANAILIVRIEPGKKPSVHVKKGDKENIVIDSPFSDDYMDVLKWLFDIDDIAEIDGEPTLLVPHRELTASERQSFKKDYTKRPEHPAYGKFDEVTITLPIFPRTIDDAAAWADQLLLDTISDYTTKEDFERKKRIVCDRFAHIYDPDRIAGRMRTLSDAIRESIAGEDRMLYWHLVAPSDLTVG